MVQTQIYPQQWMALTKPYREVLKKAFGISGPSAPTEVRDNYVVTDGHTAEDLKAVTLEKMNEYIGSTETFGRAWEITIAKVHAELNPPIAEVKKIDGTPTFVNLLVPEADILDVKEITPAPVTKKNNKKDNA
jgi:hypothetical protein